MGRASEAAGDGKQWSERLWRVVVVLAAEDGRTETEQVQQQQPAWARYITRGRGDGGVEVVLMAFGSCQPALVFGLVWSGARL
jgi:hypothetical protein